LARAVLDALRRGLPTRSTRATLVTFALRRQAVGRRRGGRWRPLAPDDEAEAGTQPGRGADREEGRSMGILFRPARAGTQVEDLQEAGTRQSN